MMRDPIEQFRDALARRNIIPPAQIIGDGALYRCDAEGRNGKGDAAYLLYLDGIAAGGFENHRDGLGWESWRANLERKLSLAEHEAHRVRIAAAQRRREADSERRRAAARDRAARIWNAASPADATHPYLIRKRVPAHGLRLHKGALVVPLRDAAGALHSLQFIAPEKPTDGGEKMQLRDGRKTGCYSAIGKPGERICIAEGYATAASIYEATGCAVAVAVDCGNLRAVAEAIHEKYPMATLVLCADDDYRTADNPGLRAATEAALAVGGLLAVTDFGLDRPDGATDFNDLHQFRGAEAVKKAIANAKPPQPAAGQAGESIAAAGDLPAWPAPRPIRASLHPVPPFDQDVLLPNNLREWVMDEAERMPCAPDFVAAAAVVALGSTIGARCAIKPKARDSWLVVPNLWGGIVALPSAKKSPAIAAAMVPLDRLAAKAQETHRDELEVFENDKVVSEARRDAIKDAIKSEAKKPEGGNVEGKAEELRRHNAEAAQPPVLRRYRVMDTTVEKLGELLRHNTAGLLALRDELTGLIASWDREGHEGDRAFWLEAWNGTGSFDTDRIGRGSIQIPNLCLSIFGGIQPDKLTEYLEQAAHALGNDGTLQRFQVLVYPDGRLWEWRDRAPNRQARDTAFRVFEVLSDFDPVEWGATPADDINRFPHFRFVEEAQQVFIEWMHDLQRERIPREQADGHPLIAQHLAKYEKLFPALALVLHLADCAALGKRGPVSREAAVRAAAWCEYLEAHARRCYGLLADQGLRAAQALSTRLQRGVLVDGFTAREVRRNGWKHLTTDTAVYSALDWLEDEGWIRTLAPAALKATGGRPTFRYEISPEIQKMGGQPTANTAKTRVSSVLAVPHQGLSSDWKGVVNG